MPHHQEVIIGLNKIFMQFFKKRKDIGSLLLRIGYAATLLFSAIVMKFQHTEEVAGVWDKVGLGWLGGPSAVMIAGVILIILSAMILFGFNARIAGGLLVIFFIVTIISTMGTPIFDKLKVWKDFTLLGVALYFLFAGSGSYSISRR